MDFRLIAIFEEFKKDFLIYEGLVLSHSIESVLSTFNRAGFSVTRLPKNKVNIKWESSNWITYDWLIHRTNNLGWFPSKMSFKKDQLNFQNAPYNEGTFQRWISTPDSELELQLEAKYDVQVEKYPKLMYHITEYKYWPKIRSKGLLPKNKNKLTPHPERVYLSLSKLDALKLLPSLSGQSSESEFALLQIDTASIPQYFKVYNDPNFNEKGVYTLNTIPPYSIELIEILHK